MGQVFLKNILCNYIKLKEKKTTYYRTIQQQNLFKTDYTKDAEPLAFKWLIINPKR